MFAHLREEDIQGSCMWKIEQSMGSWQRGLVIQEKGERTISFLDNARWTPKRGDKALETLHA